MVQQRGVTVSKSTRNYLMIVGLTTDDSSLDNASLNDYASSKLESTLSRVPGVGEVTIFGTGCPCGYGSIPTSSPSTA